MNLYSSHVMMFPFEWELKQKKELSFGKRYHLHAMKPAEDSPWQRKIMPANEAEKIELYNAQNFFYEFVQNTLHDKGDEPQPVIHHYERMESSRGNLSYEIGLPGPENRTTYLLNISSITLNLYGTGTGILYMMMDNFQYPLVDDIEKINYYGSRVFPACISADSDDSCKMLLPDYIRVAGLRDGNEKYTETFNHIHPPVSRRPARFLSALIQDLNPALSINPILNDSMFVMCWYFNPEWGEAVRDKQVYSSLVRSKVWRDYLFVAPPGAAQIEDKPAGNSLKSHLYSGWRQNGTLLGITRQSFVVVSRAEASDKALFNRYFHTVFVRMVTLALMQRISILKFSAEVSRISVLTRDDDTRLVDRIDDFYMAYIRFVNQSHYLEVTGREEGIALYDLLLDNMRIKEQVKDLDNEMEELHKFSIVLEKKAQGRNINLLTLLGSLFLVPSFIAGFYGMNLFPDELKENIPLLQAVIVLILLISGGLWAMLSLSRQENRRFVNFLFAAVMALVVIVMGLSLLAAMQA